MARNEEKAKNMMNRWTTFKQELRIGRKDRRPHLATECDSVSDAERHRRTILGEISEKMSQIQNAGSVRRQALPFALLPLPVASASLWGPAGAFGCCAPGWDA